MVPKSVPIAAQAAVPPGGGFRVNPHVLDASDALATATSLAYLGEWIAHARHLTAEIAGEADTDHTLAAALSRHGIPYASATWDKHIDNGHSYLQSFILENMEKAQGQLLAAQRPAQPEAEHSAASAAESASQLASSLAELSHRITAAFEVLRSEDGGVDTDVGAGLALSYLLPELAKRADALGGDASNLAFSIEQGRG